MASVKLALIKNVWQEVGAIAFVGNKGTDSLVELVNADSLPTGNEEASMQFSNGNIQSVPSPATGSWYVRTTADIGVFKFTEVG